MYSKMIAQGCMQNGSPKDVLGIIGKLFNKHWAKSQISSTRNYLGNVWEYLSVMHVSIHLSFFRKFATVIDISCKDRAEFPIEFP